MDRLTPLQPEEGVPFVLETVRRVVEEHEVGMVLEERTPQALAKCVEKLYQAFQFHTFQLHRHELVVP